MVGTSCTEAAWDVASLWDAVEFNGVVIQSSFWNGFRRLFDNLQSNGIDTCSKVTSRKYKINVR